MSARRPAAARGLKLLSVLLLGGLLVQTPAARAQAVPASAAPLTAQAAPSPDTTPAQRRAATPAPLTQAERTALDALYRKLRPATLRIEDCPPTNCAEPNGVGTAFHIGDGYALTAYHVVFASRTLSAQTLDRKRYAVQVIGYDDQSDLALIRVNVPANTPFMPLAARGPSVGDPALSIGNGGGAFLLPKTGRLTGLDSDAGRADFPPGTLELNAQLVPGDSGGPVINARGEVVGVVSYISVGGPRGGRITAYAVPVTRTDERLAALRRGEKRDAPVIGIGLTPQLDFAFALPADQFAEFSRTFDLGLGDTPGAFFTNVVPGSPAARAGLQPLTLNEQGRRVSGDLVTAVNGQPVTNFSDFQYAVRRYRPGDTVTLTVLRGGRTIAVNLTLAARPQLQN